MKHYRVLHAPASVGGHPQGLSRALRLAGVHSASWIFQQNYFSYPADQVIWTATDGLLRRELKRLFAIVRATRFHVIHYNFGACLASPFPPDPPDVGGWRRWARTAHRVYLDFLNRTELALWRLLRKPVFVVYQGDDARQGDFCLEHFAISIASQVPVGYYSASSDAFKRAMILRLSAACDGIYALNPDLLHVLPAKARFQPYAHVFPEDWPPVFTQGDPSRPLRIGHAPTHRSVKGTHMLLAALERLRAQGLKFDLVLIEGLPHAEARRLYEGVDVVVDQLYAGWYGGVAVEAMALGKPVVAYLREEDLAFLPESMRSELPIVRATPSSIEEVLRTLIEMPRPELLDLGRRSREFVERWHDPRRIAAEQMADYEAALKSKQGAAGAAAGVL